MSSDEVRLWRWHPAYFIWRKSRPMGDDNKPTSFSEEYVALPAATHAALMRVVEAAVARVGFERGIEGIGMTDSSERERHRWLVRCENAAVDAYLATAPERRGDGAKDGREKGR